MSLAPVQMSVADAHIVPHLLQEQFEEGLVDGLVVVELHVHQPFSVKEGDDHQLLATACTTWNLRSVLILGEPLHIFLLGASFSEVEPRLICGYQPVQKVWNTPCPPQKVLAEEYPLSALGLGKSVGHQFRCLLLHFEVRSQDLMRTPCRNSEACGQLLDADVLLSLHKNFALSDVPPSACSLGCSGAQDVAQLGSSIFEGLVPEVNGASAVRPSAKSKFDSIHTILGIHTHPHRKPHTDTLEEFPGNPHCHVGSFLIHG